MLFLCVLNIHLMKEVKEESTQKRKIVRKKEKEMMMIEGKVGLNLMSFEAGVTAVTAQLLSTIFLLF